MANPNIDPGIAQLNNIIQTNPEISHAGKVAADQELNLLAGGGNAYTAAANLNAIARDRTFTKFMDNGISGAGINVAASKYEDVLNVTVPASVTDAGDKDELTRRTKTRVGREHLVAAEGSADMTAYWGPRGADPAWDNSRTIVSEQVENYAAGRVAAIQNDIRAGNITAEQAIQQLSGIPNVDIRNACLRIINEQPRNANIAGARTFKYDVGPAGADRNKSIVDIKKAGDGIGDPTTQAQVRESATNSFLNAHFDRIAAQPNLAAYVATLLAPDQPTIDALGLHTPVYAEGKANALLGAIDKGTMTFDQAYRQAMSMPNAEIRAIMVSRLQKRDEYKNYVLNQKFPGGIGPKMFTTKSTGTDDPFQRPMADIDTVAQAVKDSDAYKRKSAVGKEDIDAGIDETKEMTAIQRKKDTENFKLAQEEKKQASRVIAELERNKLFEQARWAFKGAKYGAILSLLALHPAIGMGMLAPLLISGTLLGSQAGLKFGDSKIGEFDVNRQKLVVKQLDQEVKVVQLKAAARNGDKKAVQDLFNLIK